MSSYTTHVPRDHDRTGRTWRTPHQRMERDSYHRVSAPQTEWGRRVLSRLDGARRRARHRRRVRHRAADRRADGTTAARAADRDRSIVEHAADGARESPPDFRDRISFVRVDLPRLPFVNGPIWSSAPRRSTGCAITTRCSARSSRSLRPRRPPVRAVRRRAQSRRGARARRRRDARGAVRAVLCGLVGRLGVRDAGDHRRPAARRRLRRRCTPAWSRRRRRSPTKRRIASS